MKRKLSTALVLALVLVMAMSVAAFAQGTGPAAGNGPDNPGMQQGQGLAPQDGTGYRRGWADDDQGMARRGTGTPVGDGVNFVDDDGDGMCDNYVDEDGDGVCDNCDQLGSGQMARRGARSQDGSADGSGMRRSGGQNGGGRGRNR